MCRWPRRSAERNEARGAQRLYCCCVGAADHDRHRLRAQVEAAGQESGEGGGPAGFGHHSEAVPEDTLGSDDLVVADEGGLDAEGSQDREGVLAHLARRQGVDGDTAGWRVDRAPGRQGAGECRSAVGLCADHADGTVVAGGNAGQQPATADGGDHGAYAGGLLLQLEGEGAGTHDCLARVVGVNLGSVPAEGPLSAGVEGLAVGLADQHRVRPEAADASDLGRVGDLGHEDLGRDAQGLGDVGHRRSVVAAGGRHDALRAGIPGQHVRERATGLERPSVLQLFELEHQPPRRQAELGPVELDHRGAPYVRPDQRLGQPGRRRGSLSPRDPRLGSVHDGRRCSHGPRPGPRRRLRGAVCAADRAAGARGSGLLRDRAAHDAGGRDAGAQPEGDRAVRWTLERLRGGRAEHRLRAVHGRHAGVRHVLRVPADGAGAGRRGRAHRGPRVRPHPGRGRGVRDAPGRRTRPAQRLDVARRLGGAGAGGVHRAGLDGGHAGGGLRGRRARAGRRPVAPGGAAHRARPEGARALPARHRRLPADLDDAQHRRGAGRGDPRSRSATAGRSARSPAASTPRWPPRSCSARSASG